MNTNPDQKCTDLVNKLNLECHCTSLDKNKIKAELARQFQNNQFYRMIVEDRPHMLSNSAVFVSKPCLAKQKQIIEALETVIQMPAYQQHVLAHAPDSASYQPKSHGVFFGYDFHLSSEGPKLIEVNTNAGGALINAILTKAHMQCCNSSVKQSEQVFFQSMQDFKKNELDLNVFFQMFLHEWYLERGTLPLKTIAIVDQQPLEQYMLPEFLLFQELFEQQGLTAIVCDPSEFSYHNGKLYLQDVAVDMVYNRLTDFGLEEPDQLALCQAYLNNSVVVTPHPRSHALYADKRNLISLTDPNFLDDIGVTKKIREVLLSGLAKTLYVKAEEHEVLWKQRKKLFFKPARGYGSKAAYRGDKLTKRTFNEILQSQYVAQELIQPSARQLKVDDELIDYKLDLRNYVYNAQIQLLSARLYQGQTTNFRTPGGGFAPVIPIIC